MWLALATASGLAREKPLPQNPPRIIDSPPEQRAALNEAANLGLPAEEKRWGIEKAKELKRQEAEKAEDRRSKTAVIPMPPPNDSVTTGSADGGVDR